MRYLFTRVLIIIIIGILLTFSDAGAAPWVESESQGACIRHPQDWRADWGGRGVSVVHPQDPMIWCKLESVQFQGASRQLAEAVVSAAATQVSDVRPVRQLQISQRPDLHGIKFSGQHKGTAFASLVLTVTEDGRNFVIRQYSSPARVYDEMKLTLIPILLSFRSRGDGAGKEDTKSGGWQPIQSPRGAWRFLAPSGWQPIAPDERTEFGVGEMLGPRGERVTVNMGRGDALHRVNVQRAYGWMATQNPVEYIRISKLPFLPAVDFVQRVYLPFAEYSNLQIIDLKPLQQDKAYFAVSYHTSQGIKMMEEGFLDNSSVPDPMGGDFNLFTVSYVKAPADIFPGERNDLWQILTSFEPSPHFGAPMIQFVAQLRSQSLEAARNMIMDRLRSNQGIARQHSGIAQQKPGLMAQQGQGWINAVTGQEVVRDPQTGQRYQVLVGGEYIYGRNTGEIIRADRPLQTHELPEGFRQFEAMGVR